MGFIQLLLTAAAAGIALSGIMALAWRVQQHTGNSGWVDTSWSLGVGTVGCAAALLPFDQQGPGWRQVAVALLVLTWGLRLGLHIAARSCSVPDDPRYRMLTEQWGNDARRRMFWFLQSQAAVGAMLVVAVALAGHNPVPGVRLQDILGLIVLVAAIAGESTADRQLRRFKSAPANRGSVCDVGLWRHSRHPNYVFEWLGWVAYPLIAIDAGGDYPLGWLALLAPAGMYWLLVHVSGIPPLEQHMLRKHGQVFRDYQARTPVFFPIGRQ